MKLRNTLLLAAVLAALIALAFATPKLHAADAPVPIADFPKGYTAEDAKADVAKLKAQDIAIAKERDEARNALAAAQAQQQQNAVVTEYYKAVAEKNQALLQLVALNEQLQAANKRIAELEAQLAAKTPETKK